jgi:SNF2 family DNA or RNA helicase
MSVDCPLVAMGDNSFSDGIDEAGGVAPRVAVRGDSFSDSSGEWDLDFLRLKIADNEDEELVVLAEDEERSVSSAEAETLELTPPWTRNKATDEIYFDSANDGTPYWPNFRLPAEVFNKLYDYQVDGVRWMGGLHSNKIGGILGDDMGMGVRSYAC